MKQTLHALFTEPYAAEQAIDRLVSLGIPLDGIHTVGAMGRERASHGDLASDDLHPVAWPKTARELIAAGLSPADTEASAPQLIEGAILVLVQMRPEQAAAVARVLRQ